MSDYFNPSDPNLIYLQSRAEVDPALVEEYAEMMRAGVQFHPAKAIGEGKTIYIYDGYHRGQAAKQAGHLLLVSVKAGTKAEAEWHALAANQEHGLRRSNADKQKIVRLALAHEFGARLSDRQIAQHCGVSHPTVARIREEMEATGKIYQSDTRIGADGREISVGNIGAQPPAYVAVWQLEQALSAWMNKNYSYGLQTQIDALESIKQKTIIGLGMLETLTTKDILPGPRRKSDVVQACNNLLSQLQQKKWREGRAERIKQMTCICGEQTLFPVGEMDELTCSACRRSWNSIHSFENTCRGCEKDLTTTLRVEGEQYCSDCWDKRSAGHTANRAWRCITQTAETCYLCGKEAIYHNNGWRGKPGADFHLCHEHYTRHQTAVTGHTDAAELQAALDQLKQADIDTSPRGLACPHCGMAAVQAADGSLKCINVDCDSWWENLLAYEAAVAGPGSAPAQAGPKPPPISHCSSCGAMGTFSKYGTNRPMCFECWLKSPEFKAASTSPTVNSADPRTILDPTGDLVNQAISLNSSQALTNDRAEGIVEVENKLYVCVGHIDATSEGYKFARLVEVVEPEFWTQPAKTYSEACKERVFSHAGQKVKIKGIEWVLTDQKLTLRWEIKSAAEDTDAKLHQLLGRALKADSDRWSKHRQAGLSNEQLVEAIGLAFGIEHGASGPDGGYNCKGLENPRFWLGYQGSSSRPPTLAGAALRDAARELLGIPFPGDAADGEGDYDFTGMTTADLETALAAIERDGLPLDSPHARRLREELAARQNGAAPDPWQPSTPGLARDLTYRHQRICIRFAGLVEKIKDIAWMDELDRRLDELEAEISGDPARTKEPAR